MSENSLIDNSASNENQYIMQQLKIIDWEKNAIESEYASLVDILLTKNSTLFSNFFIQKIAPLDKTKCYEFFQIFPNISWGKKYKTRNLHNQQ